MRTGYFDTYQKDDKLYLAIPKDRLGKNFLMEMKIAQGIGVNSLFGGTMLNIFEGNLVALERRADQIFLVQRPHRFTAKNDAAAAKAVDLTYGSSVVESAPIVSFREDSAMVVDVANWFVSDLSGVGAIVRNAVSPGPGRPGVATFDRTRSYLESVKGFPQNINVRAKLTFRPAEPVGWPSVPDGRYIPLSIHYTMAALPATPMEPRYGDDRVGNFWTVHKDFSQEDTTTFVRLVNRWRLEPGERVGDKIRPKQPITYYIDPNVPQAYRAGFKAGVEAWNSAFEAAGWSGAIRAIDLPADADPEDIRFATLRWNVSDQPGYGAIGPSTVDPRTGEVLDADILFESTMFGNYKNNWRNLIGPASAATALEQALGMGAFEPAPGQLELQGFASAFTEQGGLLRASLIASGALGVRDPVPAPFVDQAVKWVVMHEVGHTLGLQHNFRSSASTPVAKLQDAAWANENGVYSSVMEYPAVNVAPKGKQTGPYYTPTVGSYDRWVISFAYTPDNARAQALTREVANPRHMYGTNAESGGPGALDPTINTFDLGEDPLEWGKQRTAILLDVLDNLQAKVLADNSSYNDLSNAFGGLMNEYARAIAPAIKHLGGAYINRDHVGDPNGRLPFVNVPRAKQREALDFVVERVFSPQALVVAPATLQRLGSNRWLHWGQNTTFNGRLDFPYHEQVLALQTATLANLLNPFRLARIRDGETKYGPASMVTIPEMMGALSQAIWTESWGPGARTTSAIRRDLQRAYVNQMTQILVQPADRTPADARSVARMQLKDLSRRLGTALAAGATLDAYSRAHLDESKARIDKALNADYGTLR
ncbi:MAG: zinc-dependent metalloprotease [Gemmatimonadales bacterium]|nr:zinc-dependent metalloprotease [Gemmatimonadales bacterium]